MLSKSNHPEEQEVWSRLFSYLLPKLEKNASSAHLAGIQELGYRADSLPTFAGFSENVERITRWKIEPAHGELEPPDFFKALAEKRFPVVPRMRPLQQLYGAIDPDFWHEAFGHISSLTDPLVSDLYVNFGKAAIQAAQKGPTQLARISKLFWSIAEYGLILENGKTKLFGAALIGSPLAVDRYEAGKITYRPFSVRAACESTFDPHRFQPYYLRMEELPLNLLTSML